MAFEISRDGDGRTLRVAGELDVAVREQLEAGFAQHSSAGEDVRMDLSEVTFIDSSGLRSLVGLTRHLRGSSAIVLVNPSQPVTRLLWLTGLDQVGVFRIEAEEALSSGDQSQSLA